MLHLLTSLECFVHDFTISQLQSIFHHANQAGETLFHQWATKKWFIAWQYLLDHYGVRLFEDCLNQQNAEGVSVLYILCGDFRFFPLLQSCIPQFQQRADFTLYTTLPAFLETPFQRICTRLAPFPLIQTILLHCARYEEPSRMLCQTNGHGNTPILLALKAGDTNLHTFQALLHKSILNHTNTFGESIALLVVTLNREMMWKSFCAFPTSSIHEIFFAFADPINQDNLFHIMARKNYTALLVMTLQIFHEHHILHTVGKGLLLQPDTIGDTIAHILVQEDHMTLWSEMMQVLVTTQTVMTIGKEVTNAGNAMGDTFVHVMAKTSKVSALERVIQRLGIITDGHITEILDCESVHPTSKDTIVQCILKTLDNKTIRKCLRNAGIKL